jgi:hypothetical protein
MSNGNGPGPSSNILRLVEDQEVRDRIVKLLANAAAVSRLPGMANAPDGQQQQQHQDQAGARLALHEEIQRQQEEDLAAAAAATDAVAGSVGLDVAASAAADLLLSLSKSLVEG